MLDLKAIRAQPQQIEQKLKMRDPSLSLAPLLKLDARRRHLIQEVEALKYQRNQASEQIARLKAAKRAEQAQELILEMRAMAERIKALDVQLGTIEEELHQLLSHLPNLPHESVPISYDKGAKVILKEHKERPEFDFPCKTHIELGKTLDLFDFERAARIAGARFALYKGLGAKLEMALVQFMFKYQIEENGYTPIWPPFLGNPTTFYTSSHLPKFKDEQYFMERDELYLNPTAEVMLCNLHRDEILEAEQLPLKYCAYTACFRREAGAAGEEERGLIRLHQFNKVELFKFTRPEDSYAELDKMVEDAEDILKALDLHYRLALLPTGDLGFAAAKTIDIEVWLPGQGRYYEVSSCSNCEDFQARRGNIRYRPSPKAKPEFVHTLNGSGLATSRLMIALLENNQRPDGSVIIPEALRDYMGLEVIRP